MAVPVADEATNVSICAKHIAGLFFVPQFVWIGMVMPLHLCRVLFQVFHLSRFQCRFYETLFEVALDAVFFHPFVDDVVTAPTHVPKHVSDARAVLFADFGKPTDAIDQLPAIASGRTPTNPVGLDQGNRITPFGQCQGGGNAGKAGADHADIDGNAAFQFRVVSHLINGGGIIGIGVLLFLMDGFHLRVLKKRCLLISTDRCLPGQVKEIVYQSSW